MTGYTLAVCNDSPDYIHRFLAYCRKQYPYYNVSGFTNLQALTDFLNDCSVDILLLPRNFIHSGQQNDNSEKRNNKPEKMIGITPLSEYESNGQIGKIVYLGEQQNLTSDPKTLNMYQSMGTLMEQLALIASALKKEAPGSAGDIDVIGLYVLDGDADIADFAISLASGHSNTGSRTLYIDLDMFSGTRFRYDLEITGTLSDLIYHYRTDPGTLAAILSECGARMSGIYYLAPPVSCGDLDELHSSEWGQFLSQISAAGNFGTIILGIPGLFKGLPELLGICGKIYLFSASYDQPETGWQTSAALSSYRMRAFRNYFEARELSDIFLKMKDGYRSVPELKSVPEPHSARFRKFTSHGKK